MRTNTHFFTPGERKTALWAVVAAVALSAAGFAWERAQGPSLGIYDQMGQTQLVDVIEAQPLG